MNLDEYKRTFGNQENATPGWAAIDIALENLYPDQNPKHWAPQVPMSIGGKDPLNGVSAYRSQSPHDHLHFCSYGMTHLFYDEKYVGEPFSKFGFEFTFRLKKSSPASDDDLWVVSVMQNLARYVYNSGKWFEENHWIPTNSKIRINSDTDLVGFAFSLDPELPAIETPHGRVEFLQLFGINQFELDKLGKPRELTKELLDKHRKTNPLLITDLARK